MKISGKTKIIGVIGYPVEHTLSPAMHNRAFESLGLDYVYVAFGVKPAHLGKVIESLRALDIRGINVTVPHKENIIKYLDRVDEKAGHIGAVNTVVSENGRFKGYNTDGTGFMKSLEKKFSPAGKSVLLLGAGGVARAIAVNLVYKKVKAICVHDVLRNKSRQLAAELNGIAGRCVAAPVSDLACAAKNAALLVNATPVGMKAGDGCAINPALLHRGLFVYDVIYNRGTRLMREAGKRGLGHIGGMEMFLYQGAGAFQLWTGKSAPVDVMRKELKKYF